jgi:hypothetical protein
MAGRSRIETKLGTRIGAALVQKGLVSAEQLDTALEKQRDLGGTLGASLLEIGALEEQDLGEALAEQLGVRYAPPGMLQEVRGPVRKVLTRPLLWKHRAVPFKLAARTLHLLVADVHNLSGLSKKTGYRIVPWLAPEVRVHLELQRHFKIPPSPRYVEIARRLEGGDAKAATADADSLRERLARADDANHAAHIALDHAAKLVPTCILFRVEDGEARVWDVRGHAMHPDARESFVAPAMSGSPLELLVIHPFYRGAVPDERAYRSFFIDLDLVTPREMILVPIKVAGRLVAILYGDGGPSDPIPTPLEEQRRLAQKLGLALTMILIRSKIQE